MNNLLNLELFSFFQIPYKHFFISMALKAIIIVFNEILDVPRQNLTVNILILFGV